VFRLKTKICHNLTTIIIVLHQIPRAHKLLLSINYLPVYSNAVANIAYKKETWVNSRRQMKRHAQSTWVRGHAARAVDGNTDQQLHSCTILDNFYIEKPVWMVDLGTVQRVSGVIIMTSLGKDKDKQPGLLR
jgi:hypothetical protein